MEALFLTSVQIYNPDTSQQEYDPETNTWSGDKTILWEGNARIQPVGAAGDTGDTYNPTLFQTIKVQFSRTNNQLTGAGTETPDFRPGHRMIVTDAVYNQNLKGFIYSVTGVMSSSNPWEVTLLCRVDTELDPNEV